MSEQAYLLFAILLFAMTEMKTQKLSGTEIFIGFPLSVYLTSLKEWDTKFQIAQTRLQRLFNSPQAKLKRVEVSDIQPISNLPLYVVGVYSCFSGIFFAESQQQKLFLFHLRKNAPFTYIANKMGGKNIVGGWYGRGITWFDELPADHWTHLYHLIPLPPPKTLQNLNLLVLPDEKSVYLAYGQTLNQ